GVAQVQRLQIRQLRKLVKALIANLGRIEHQRSQMRQRGKKCEIVVAYVAFAQVELNDAPRLRIALDFRDADFGEMLGGALLSLVDRGALPPYQPSEKCKCKRAHGGS